MFRMAVPLLAAAAVALAGCSGSDGGARTTAEPTSGAATGPGATGPGTTGPGTSGPAASSTAGTAADLRRALLTAAELGDGFRATGTSGSGDTPLPCTPTAQPLFVARPPVQREIANFANGTNTVLVTETVARYPDEDAARAALTTGAKGFSCSRGSIAGKQVGIVPRNAALPGADVDQVGAWDFANAEVKGTAALVRVDEYLVAMVFGAEPGAGGDVQVGTILTTAATKIDDLD